MKDSSLDFKKYRIKYIASTLGIQKAEQALKSLGFASKANFAKSHLLSISTVTKFWLREPIKADSFIRICNQLQLNWQDIVEIEEEESQVLMRKKSSNYPIYSEVNLRQKIDSTVTITNKFLQTITAEIILKSSTSFSSDFQLIGLIFQKCLANRLKKLEIHSSSIKLILEVSQENIQHLVSLIEWEQLTSVNDFGIESVEILPQSYCLDENGQLEPKWRLVREIVTQPLEGRQLRNADLSSADFSHADLSHADLSDADLSDADLNDADLSGANLIGANLIGASLIGATINSQTKLDLKWRLVLEIVNGTKLGRDLSHANLIRANLSGANLIGAQLPSANLSNANLIGINLIGANLSNANLIGTNLIDANLSRANLSRANLTGANLTGADLAGADLAGANLISANLIGTNLTGTNLIDASLIGVNLIGTILKNARFARNAGLTDHMKLELERLGGQISPP